MPRTQAAYTGSDALRGTGRQISVKCGAIMRSVCRIDIDPLVHETRAGVRGTSRTGCGMAWWRQQRWPRREDYTLHAYTGIKANAISAEDGRVALRVEGDAECMFCISCKVKL